MNARWRFRRLTLFDAEKKTAVEIMSAVALHNICIMKKENIDFIELNEVKGNDVARNYDDNEAERDIIASSLVI